MPAGYEVPKGRHEYEQWRGKHERVKCERAEFELAKERGEYLPRATQADAAAVVLAMLAQSLRSLPDNLERTAGLSPEQAEIVATHVDLALSELAAGLRQLAGEPAPS
jgi:hypothetical protein